jgi:hypothetical protein
MNPNTIVAPEDCLRGWKEIEIALRDGGVRKVKVKALNWRASILVSQLVMTDPGLAAIRAVEECLDKADRMDEVLNTIVPADLATISNVALMLSNGVEAAKKMMAAMNEIPSLKTSSPPNATSSNAVTGTPPASPSIS